MPALDAAAMGVRIAEARGRAGLTQAQLAAATSLDRSALAKIENGTRRVSALELARIADAVDERIEWFVTDAPPAVVSHRNMLEPGTASPAIDRLIERLAREVEFLLRHDDRLTLPEVTGLDRPSNGDEAELMANKARVLMGVDPQQPLLRLADAAARVGILSFAFELGTGAADAASILLSPGAVAVVNGTLRVGRRRLALAHEIGHCLFADEYTVDLNVAEHNESDVWEVRLDRFARALLLPRTALERSWSDLRRREDVRTAAVKLASRFRVDMSTLARRLSELRQVDAEEAQSIRRIRTTRADIVELNLVVDDELAPPFLSRPYVQSVLRLYRSSTVSAARATDLLFDTWDEEDLPVLPELPEDAIWAAIR
jgi:Zn-dependent peptidase ImmA (M78 family)/transcriptional regulator with XRE-family HTH domain